jgi:hypothetical protein
MAEFEGFEAEKLPIRDQIVVGNPRWFMIHGLLWY